MNNPNEDIIIYDGKMSLVVNEGNEIIVNGLLIFRWFTTPRIHFIIPSPNITLEDFNHFKPIYTIKVDNNPFSLRAMFIAFSMDERGYIRDFSGIIADENNVLGDKNVSVDKVIFSLINFNSVAFEELELSNNHYSITLTKKGEAIKYKKMLESNGGYCALHHGEITKLKNRAIHNSDISDIAKCLNAFLSFIEGRKVACFFHKGIHDNNTVWKDCTLYEIEPFADKMSWSYGCSADELHLSTLWEKFTPLWSSNKEFIETLIKWYTLANISKDVDNSIIIAQTALELIFNWWIVGERRMIKDADINASNKIRLIISQLGIRNDIPISFEELKKIANNSDAPDVIVQIRNTIVHSNDKSKLKSTSISQTIKREALFVSLWYIEMFVLFILDFKDKYRNRVTGGWAMEKVPWL